MNIFQRSLRNQRYRGQERLYLLRIVEEVKAGPFGFFTNFMFNFLIFRPIVGWLTSNTFAISLSVSVDQAFLPFSEVS